MIEKYFARSVEKRWKAARAVESGGGGGEQRANDSSGSEPACD